jgi:hypothetical protein
MANHKQEMERLIEERTQTIAPAGEDAAIQPEPKDPQRILDETDKTLNQFDTNKPVPQTNPPPQF